MNEPWPIIEDFKASKRVWLYYIIGLLCILLCVTLIADVARANFRAVPVILIASIVLVFLYRRSENAWQKRQQIKWFVGRNGLVSRAVKFEKSIPWSAILEMRIVSSGVAFRYEETNDGKTARVTKKERLYLSKSGIELFIGDLGHFKKVAVEKPIKQTETRRSFFSYIPEISITGLAGLVICWTAYNGIVQLRSYSWPSVGGIITFSQCEESRVNPTGAYLRLSYNYVVDHKQYQSDRFRIWFRNYEGDTRDIRAYCLQHQPGDSLKVYYDPLHPEMSVIKPGPAWSTIGALIFGSISITLMSWLRQIVAKRSRGDIIYSKSSGNR